MRKFVIEKVVIALLTPSLFFAFMLFALDNQKFTSQGEKVSFQQSWQIENAQFPGYLSSF